MSLSATEMLRELVAIPSVNPMGRDVDGDIYFEHRVTNYLQAKFEALRLPFLRQHVEPKRENIIARLDATRAANDPPVMLWEVHQDTVPVDGMIIDPFTPESTSERISGRGSCDVKGGMSAMLAALARLINEPHRPRTILFACTVNEEYGFSGAKELMQLWGADANAAARRFAPKLPEVAIVAEPTEMNVVVAHKGAIRWRIRTLGKACHSSNPANGLNAIYMMRPVLAAIEAYQSHLTAHGLNHSYCGRPTVSVGLISGGVSVNTVPDQCVIEIDRRVTPGEEPDAARAEMISFIESTLRQQLAKPHTPNDVESAHIARLLDGGLVHDEPHLCGMPLPDDENRQLAELVSKHAANVHGQSEIIGVPFGTDASVISAAGVPSIVFGPGSILQAHTCDEWISIAQLNEAVETLVRLGTSQ